MLENVYEGLNAQKCKGRSNQKNQKTKSIYFFANPPKLLVSWLVGKFRISNLWSVLVAQIKKN